MNITVETILRHKGNGVFFVTPGTTLYEALKVLAEKDIGALLVFESDDLVGIFSERDYARKVVLEGRHAETATVGEVMTGNVTTVDVCENIENCMDLMTNRHIRHLPVIKNGAVVGVISIGDIVKEIISEQQIAIQHLEHYITGGR
jgi:CBS domain-containing protein